MYNFNIKIFLLLFQRTKFIFKILYPPVSKIHFPRSWWKDCRKSETTQHTMILRTRTSSIPFSITDLQRIYHSQIQKSIWSSLLYRAPILGKKNPCSTLSPWNIPPFLRPQIPIVYLPRANCEHERKFHPQSVTFKRETEWNISQKIEVFTKRRNRNRS